MDEYTEEELTRALGVVSSTLLKCEKMYPRFAAGTSSHTLLKNRIRALQISQALLTGEKVADKYTKEGFQEALRPVSSIISKCEKAQLKLGEGTSSHTRFKNIIEAMEICRALVMEEIAKRD